MWVCAVINIWRRSAFAGSTDEFQDFTVGECPQVRMYRCSNLRVLSFKCWDVVKCRCCCRRLATVCACLLDRPAEMSPCDWLSPILLWSAHVYSSAFLAPSRLSRVTGLYHYYGMFFIIYFETTTRGPYVIRLMAFHIGVFWYFFDFVFLKFFVSDRSPESVVFVDQYNRFCC